MWARPDSVVRGRLAGFTLLELLVVLAIVASLAAMFPLALNRFLPARRVDAAARELLADIRLAQARSVAMDAIVVLALTPTGYEVRDLDPKGAVVQNRSLRQSTKVGLRFVDGLRELPALRVYPDGSSSGGRFVIVDGDRRRELTVSELTGRVRLNLAAAPGEPR